jgi:DNA-binding response OmpR family regulator
LINILLLEDDSTLAETLIELLSDENYEVSWVRDGESAIDITYEKNFDLMLLDVNVPNLDGFSMLKLLRESSNKTPAIFLTSLNDISSLAKGFEVGANDYMKKPFDFDELLIRINALISQSHNISKNIINLKEFSFDIVKGELYKEKVYIKLTNYEQRLVQLLFKSMGTTMSKDDILYELAHGEEASEGALRVRINKLRKIGLPIQTIKNVGYRLE